MEIKSEVNYEDMYRTLARIYDELETTNDPEKMKALFECLGREFFSMAEEERKREKKITISAGPPFIIIN